MALWGNESKVAPKKKPKVLIGVPGFAGVQPGVQENFFHLAYHCGRYAIDYDFSIKIVTKREQFRARNGLVDIALVNGCEYLLMLDDDMVVPPDLFLKLVAHDKDIVGALYFQRGGAFHPVLMKMKSKVDGFKSIQFLNHWDQALMKPGLHPVDVIGGGCMLFKVSAFEKIQQPYFWIDGIVGTDVYICNRLMEAGIQPYVDTTIELGHWDQDGSIITSRTVPRYKQTLGVVNEAFWNDLKDYFQLGDFELESEMIASSEGNIREEKWHTAPRDTWDGVKAFYTKDAKWQILNLARYNLDYDQARDWALNEIGRVAKPTARILDYGSGLGYCSVPLAQQGYRMTAIDLQDNPCLEFLRWRQDKHKLHPDRSKQQGSLDILPLDTSVPTWKQVPYDGVLMISVIDHLYEPYKALEWVAQHLNVGGFLLCDTWRQYGQRKDEPQHLYNYTPEGVLKLLKKHGIEETPENPYLFLKKR